MSKEIDLNLLDISPAAFAAWQEMSGRIAVVLAAMAEMGKEIPPIPDERARINDDGTLTIYVEISGILSVSMNVPADQWAYENNQN